MPKLLPGNNDKHSFYNKATKKKTHKHTHSCHECEHNFYHNESCNENQIEPYIIYMASPRANKCSDHWQNGTNLAQFNGNETAQSEKRENEGKKSIKIVNSLKISGLRDHGLHHVK